MTDALLWFFSRYISFGQSVLDDNSLSFPDFVRLLLPSIVRLREDPVPNVRITLGRFLSHVITAHSGDFGEILWSEVATDIC